MGVPWVIRPCAFAFVHSDGRLLVARFRDPDDGSPYFRPLGGGIDFGETGEEAVRREFREELCVELGSVRPLGSIENLFEMRGERYHELCFIFVAEPDGWALSRFDGFVIAESVGPGFDETATVWEANRLDALSPLYPEGVADLIRAWLASS
jgi:ADP-ribose pyrophosphatase YjhB (NUDIX family)